MFIPEEIKEMFTPVKLFSCTGYKSDEGVHSKVMAATPIIIYVNAKSYGGTEQLINNKYTVLDTMAIVTRYIPAITANSELEFLDGRRYEIVGEPENFSIRNMFLRFKIQRIGGRP